MKLPNFGYHFARAEANACRRIYAAALNNIVHRRIAIEQDLSFDVFSYSSERDLPEQVASIRSFLKFAGRPARYTVVSDGTHTTRSIALLTAIDKSVQIARAPDYAPADLRASTHAYLSEHPMGRQLALIMSLPVDKPTLYADSDVLFFPGASELARFVPPASGPAYYLQDCRLSADERIFRSPSEKIGPVNTGLLFLFEKLDWSLALERFAALGGTPVFFTNQTMTHLTMHASGAQPLDPAKYVLQLDDQFVHRDAYASRDIVLRHYVNPVRHKFWTTLLRTWTTD